MIDAVINLFIVIIKRLCCPKPNIISIYAFSINDVQLCNISNDHFTILSITPMQNIKPFPKNFLVKPNDPFFIYLSPSLWDSKSPKIKMKILLSNGTKRKYTITWDKNTPYLQ